MEKARDLCGFRTKEFGVSFEVVLNDDLKGKQGGWRLKSVSRMACDLTGRATAYADANERS